MLLIMSPTDNKTGMTENKFLGVKTHMRENGSAAAFLRYCGAGSNGALPHAQPPPRSRLHEPIVIDRGGFEGYSSDLTARS